MNDWLVILVLVLFFGPLIALAVIPRPTPKGRHHR